MSGSIRRGVTVLVLVCATALTAPGSAAGSGQLSMDKARHTAQLHANELCAADDRCTGFTIGKCNRLGPKRIRCKTLLDRKGNHECRYKIVVRKVNGEVKGKVGEITCT